MSGSKGADGAARLAMGERTYSNDAEKLGMVDA